MASSKQENSAEELALAMRKVLLEAKAAATEEQDSDAAREMVADDGTSIQIPKRIPINRGVTVDSSSSNISIGVTYPSEWFEKNGWIKPVLTLPKLLVTDTYAELKRPIREGITEGSFVSAEDIKLFLHFLLKDVKEEAPKDWISMGVVIAKKGDKIGLLDLFTLKVEEAGNERVKVAEQEDAEKLAYLILITGCYRISNEKNKFQREKLGKLINTKVAEAGLRGRYVENGLKAMDSAYYDRELIKLFSGMDMFYHFFPNSFYARSRVGTECLRFKDCSALGYLDYLADFMKMPAQDIKYWFLNPFLERDWERIYLPNQEVDDPYSYMPYMMGLGLSHKSPYSASINQSLHSFVHLVGCAAHQPRSINAHIFNETPMFPIADNAAIFYYAMRRTTSEGGGSSNLLPVDASYTSKEPKTTDPAEWCDFIHSWKGKGTFVPDYMEQAVYRVWASIGNSRERTVGAWARTRAINGLKRAGK